MIDYQGIAIVIGAGSAAVAAIGGFVLQVMTFRASHKRDLKLSEVHDLVNGMSEAKEKAATTIGMAEGKALGIRTERADPHAGPAPKTPVK